MARGAEHIAIDKIINYKRATHIECQSEVVIRVMNAIFGSSQ